uniref:RdRp n=1 Tax=viral metagenome TaxID=1070528 RepID=A0A2V0RA07_9ZZZZ
MSNFNQQAVHNLRNRYDTLRKYVEDGIKAVRPSGASSFVDMNVDSTSQWVMMQSTIAKFLQITIPDEDYKEVESMLTDWSVADRSDSNSDPTSSDYFPTIIRAHGKENFDPIFKKRAAVFTRYGMDALLMEGQRSNGERGVAKDDYKKIAFVSSVTSSPVVLQPHNGGEKADDIQYPVLGSDRGMLSRDDKIRLALEGKPYWVDGTSPSDFDESETSKVKDHMSVHAIKGVFRGKEFDNLEEHKKAGTFVSLITNKKGEDFLILKHDKTTLSHALETFKDGKDLNKAKPEVKNSERDPTRGYVGINGVALKLTEQNPLETASTQDPTCGVSYTESWLSRWPECRRYTPFTLASTYLTWVEVLSLQYGDNWAEWKRNGGMCLLIGVCYLAAEWTARMAPLNTFTKSQFSMKRMIEGWSKGKPPSGVPQWMARWRSHKSYTYVTANDIGYDLPDDKDIMEWSREVLSKEIGGVTPVATPMPFIEKGSGGYPLQEGALTTSGPLRMFLCLTLAIETCGSQHLSSFNDYYIGCLKYLGRNPGRIGRKLGKATVNMARLLGCDVTLHVPTLAPVQGDDYFCQDTNRRRIQDKYALSLLMHKFKITGDTFVDFEGCKMKVAKAISAMDEIADTAGPPLLKIFEEFGSYPNCHDRYGINNFNNSMLDALTHLQHSGSVEGYVRSCIGSLPVAGYMSMAQRVVMEGINSDSPNEADQHERAIWEPIIDRMLSPSVPTMFKQLHSLSNAKSSGQDKIKFKIDAKYAVDGASNREHKNIEGFVSNRKDAMAITGSLLINDEYMHLKSSSLTTFTSPGGLPTPRVTQALVTGLRSTPARILRYIYNLPIPNQVLLYSLYAACLDYMKASVTDPIYGYSLTQKEGVPVYDEAREIRMSIAMASDESLVSLAIDASKLDQHIGKRHRRVLIETLRSRLVDSEDATVIEKLGDSYIDLLCDMLEEWGNSYYKMVVPQSPTQILHVDTQPSGALTTAVDNTVTTMGMVHMIEAKSNVKPIKVEVWGDDLYFLYHHDSSRSFPEFVEGIDSLGQEAGQVLSTAADSTTGRHIHFLQKLFIGGQVIKRRMAYDHENEVMGHRTPGEIGEFLDKARELSSRGGNSKLLNMLQLVTLVNGGRTTLYGRQANISFDTMAAPGGTVNRILSGFSGPNSKLYLELNKMTLFGDRDVEVNSRVRYEEARSIGKRMLEDANDPGLGPAPIESVQPGNARVTVGGVEKDYNLADLQEKSTASLLDYQRLLPEAQRTRIYEKLLSLTNLHESELESYSYANSIVNSSYRAVGDVAVTKHLASKFREQALLKSGLIGKTLTEVPTPVTEPASSHTGIRIGDKTVVYGFDSNWAIMLPDTPGDEFLLCEYDIMSNAWQEHERYKQNWHPYYGYPENRRQMLSLLGITAESRIQLGIKTFIKRFSPAHMRKDLTSENVMDALSRVDTSRYAHARNDLARLMGFTASEADSLNTHLAYAGLYRDINTADDYASTPDEIKSCSSQVAIDILEKTSFGAWESIRMTQELKNVILYHYVCLLSDEACVACSETDRTEDNSYRVIARGDARLLRTRMIRVPTVTVKLHVNN